MTFDKEKGALSGLFLKEYSELSPHKSLNQRAMEALHFSLENRLTESGTKS